MFYDKFPPPFVTRPTVTGTGKVVRYIGCAMLCSGGKSRDLGPSAKTRKPQSSEPSLTRASSPNHPSSQASIRSKACKLFKHPTWISRSCHVPTLSHKGRKPWHFRPMLCHRRQVVLLMPSYGRGPTNRLDNTMGQIRHETMCCSRGTGPLRFQLRPLPWRQKSLQPQLQH